MIVTLDINDNKATAFLNFIKSLDFITVEEKIDEPTTRELLKSIEDGLTEVKMHSEGKIKLQSARDFLNEI